MRASRGLAFAFGCWVIATSVVACGVDDTSPVSPEDSGPDVTMVGDADSSMGTLDGDAGTDGGDATVGLDATGDGDASPSTSPDALADAGMDGEAAVGAEPSPEASADAADAAPEAEAGNAGDASDAEAGGSTADLLAFPGKVADAFCDRIQACCAVPSASFNLAKCRSSILAGVGFGILNETSLLDGGHVVLSAATAQTCINRLLAIDCAVNSITTQQATGIFGNCFSALQGTLDAGASCSGTIECAPGEFCFPLDGGVGPAGTCMPLRTAGQPCGDFGGSDLGAKTATADNACSYRSSGNTGLFCDFADLTTPAEPYLPASAWKCTPQVPLDGGCYTDLECKTFVCATDSPYPCVSARPLLSPSGCATFKIPDAGSD
jgi:hypothetical protein